MAQAFLLWARTLAIFAACFCLVRCEGNTGEESLPQSDERESEDRKEFNQGTVLFNNPKLLPQNSNDGKDWAQDFDRTQEAFNPNIMGGVNILQEALTLGDKLRDLSNADMGVLSMQVRVQTRICSHRNEHVQNDRSRAIHQICRLPLASTSKTVLRSLVIRDQGMGVVPRELGEPPSDLPTE